MPYKLKKEFTNITNSMYLGYKTGFMNCNVRAAAVYGAAVD